MMLIKANCTRLGLRMSMRYSHLSSRIVAILIEYNSSTRIFLRR